MIPREFEYHAPKTLPDALGLLAQFGDDAKLLAGGHSLLPMMKLRFAQPGHLIDLGRIAELKGIREDGGTLAHRRDDDRERAHLVEARCRTSARCWSRARARSPIRRCATRARSAATSRTATRATTTRRSMLALGASFVLRGAAGERVVAGRRLLPRHLRRRCMAAGEIMTEIRIPVPRARHRLCLRQAQAQDRRLRHRRRGRDAAHERRASSAMSRIALTNVGPTALKARAAEAVAARQGARTTRRSPRPRGWR